MINIQALSKTTKIYLVTNCYGDPNKVYIGKEKSHKNCKRENRHIITYGSQIIFTFIDEIFGWDKLIWKPLECYWIEQFKAWGFEVLNKNRGGSGPSFLSEESRNKISKSKIGRPNSNKSRNKGRIITKEENKKRSLKLKGLKRSKESIEKMSLIRKQLKLKAKPIIQYDLNMNPIKEWLSTTDANLETKIKGIGNVLTKRAKTAGGYIWKYKQLN